MGDRPSGEIRVWASDAAYPSAAPNKLDPGNASAQKGFEPKTSYPAQFFNFLQNDVTLRLAYHDAIEVKNWNGYNKPKGAQSFPAYPIPNAAVWDPFNALLYLACGQAGAFDILRSTEGTNWTSDTSGVASGVLACRPSDGVVWAFGTTPGTSGKVKKAGVWSASAAMPSGAGNYCAEYDPSFNLFIVGGVSTTTHPRIWTAGDTTASIASATVGAESTVTGRITNIAIKPSGNRLAVGINGSSQMVSWTATNPANWSYRGARSDLPRGLRYGAADACFMITTAGGAVLTSGDGITWTSVFLNINWSFYPGCLAVKGGLWIAAVEVDGVRPVIVYSVNKGVTWNVVPWPFPDITLLPVSIVLVDDRFLVYNDGGEVMYSLRT